MLAADWCYQTETYWVMNCLTWCLVASMNCFKVKVVLIWQCHVPALKCGFFIHLLNVTIYVIFGACATVVKKKRVLISTPVDVCGICAILLHGGWHIGMERCLRSHQLLLHVGCAAKSISNCGCNVVFNFIAVTLPSTGQTPKQQLLKQEIQRDDQELKIGGEGNETHVCMTFVTYCDICLSVL